MSLKLFKQYINICKELGVNPTLEGASNFKSILNNIKNKGVRVMSVQQMLEEAINIFGLNDARTIELSQLRDEEIVRSQRKIYEKWIINQEV